jgi:hypothetical protein
LPPLRLTADGADEAVMLMLLPSSHLSTRVQHQACANLPKGARGAKGQKPFSIRP